MGFGSSKPLPLPENMNAVIVGGGYGGTQMANNLKGRCNVILIDPKDAFHHNMAALRAAVEPGFAPKTLIPYQKTYGDVFKRGLVTSINTDENSVVLDTGEKVPFTHLFIATGSRGPFPGKLVSPPKVSLEKGVEMYSNIADQIKNAKDIVVVGGGAVGVELAGEIATDYKDKKVTLVHPHQRLADPKTNDQFQDQIKSQLKDLGVNVLLGERVSNLSELPACQTMSTLNTVKTDTGKEIGADLVVPCTGLRTNTSAYENGLADKMDKDGCLKVNEYFQVEGTKNIYAFGDCANVAETKLAYNAGVHADKIAKNLENEAAGKQLAAYKPANFFMAMSCGRNGGMMQMGGWVVGSFVARRLKSGQVFVPMVWKKMGQPIPESKP
ncbi:ferroptosis suppressor protein 1-like [Saccoglossus kowalevskii]|uniref:Ferroptosis suppressor protein 1 n=1 Tax=Saccoglossus kowalevskii TaxID=10224 RepID=A0ABM0GYS1_SACKO|nr:PREDICTED: apoptosis-inducing factor 2-like [Saccoglossus kowalevskii]